MKIADMPAEKAVEVIVGFLTSHWQHRPCGARDAEIVRLTLAGMIHADAARKFGISPTRVGQIWRYAGRVVDRHERAGLLNTAPTVGANAQNGRAL